MENFIYKNKIKYVQKEIEVPEGYLLLEYPVEIEKHREICIEEISKSCYSTIIAGCDVTLSDGTTEHFALEETDQINLTNAFNAISNGATSYPYHADGELCRMYSAEDLTAISEAATAHKLYHTTYCNHLLAWIKRAETAEELESITYGAELPEDLAANMQEIMTNAKNI